MTILVTGGAGYIGSVAVDDLRKNGEDVVVIDNLVYGHRGALNPDIPLYQCSIGDQAEVREIISKYSITACMHFSAFAYVGESVVQPARYFENNFIQTVRLLDALIEMNVKKFVFSSTCAVYGEPKSESIDESHPQWPVNPYGWTKFMIERTLEAYDAAYGLRFVALRYFNACGATKTHGEHHEPETHLIPLILDAAAGKRPHVSVFGVDYPTPDGTAIRDYIHVSDLSSAHVLALEHLRRGGSSEAINLGNGSGYSVREVIDSARRVTGREIGQVSAPRRAGDPSRLVANAAKAASVLGWKPRIPEIDEIVATAWEWRLSNPHGYE
jgi:UDP-glucose 4-epimerase